jgi:nucleoside 2-deoxyribosyltransferase
MGNEHVGPPRLPAVSDDVPRVYTAGPRGDWREDLSAEFDEVEWVNPFDLNEYGSEAAARENAREVYERDQRAVEAADAVYLHRTDGYPCVGAAMEAERAAATGTPVVVENAGDGEVPAALCDAATTVEDGRTAAAQDAVVAAHGPDAERRGADGERRRDRPTVALVGGDRDWQARVIGGAREAGARVAGVAWTGVAPGADRTDHVDAAAAADAVLVRAATDENQFGPGMAAERAEAERTPVVAHAPDEEPTLMLDAVAAAAESVHAAARMAVQNARTAHERSTVDPGTGDTDRGRGQ